jgi:choline-sulfatase
MNRFLTARLVLALTSLLSTIVASAAKPPSDQTARPEPVEGSRLNVLMIAIDDLNDWVGYLDGHPEVLTPNLDRLAERGRNFTNAHCSVPVCSASRVSVMSGVAATTHGSYELGPSYQELPALTDVPTIQRYFKDNGYLTLAGGKVLHGQGFTDRLASDIDRPLDHGLRSARPKEPINSPSKSWDYGPFPEDKAEQIDYQLAGAAASVLGEEFDQPFFMSVGFRLPHVPLFVPEEYFDRYDPEKITLPNNPLSDLDDLPPNFTSINEYAVAPTHAEVLERGAQRDMTQAYLACITFVDECVGIVLDALDQSPHKDNTIIVLWSDHGFHLGEKQHWAKRTLWEESTRVPLLIAGPGIAPGEPCREPASLLDIYPTLVELCDLPDNPHLEGLSLTPQLADPAAARDQPAITSAYYGNHAIRTRNWRYIRYEDGAEELYDHRSDPDEFHNLADDPAHEAIIEQLSRSLPKEAAPEFKETSERLKGQRGAKK